MSNDGARWGRAKGSRIQHAWEPIEQGRMVIVPVCRGVGDRVPKQINFASDAARCERCEHYLRRQPA